MKQMTFDCIEWVKTYFKDNNQTKLIPWPNLSIPAEEEKRIIKDSFIHF